MLPREITTEHWPDRTSYDFPRRPIGRWRFLGLLPIAFSILFISVPTSAGLHFWRQFSAGKGGAAELIFGIFIGAFILAGLVPFSLGLFMLAGRTRVVAGADRLIITEIAGPVRRRRKLRFSDIVRLELRSGPKTATPGDPSVPTPMSGLAGLNAVMRDGKSRMVLVGYPREWLEPVAADLSGVIRLTGADVEVKAVEGPKPEPRAPVERNVPKPAASRVQVEYHANGLTMQVPPAGLRRGGRGMAVVGLFWCLLLTIITVVMLRSKGAHGPPWPIWIFFAIFWFVGAALVAAAINMGRRRAALTVESGSLRIEQHGLFGARKYAWNRGEIGAVAAGPSGIKINNVPVLELQIRPAKGKKVGLLAGRAEDELRWMASELNSALGLKEVEQGVEGWNEKAEGLATR